jgi:flagellar biosynthesis anti-sigma factor FlgM
MKINPLHNPNIIKSYAASRPLKAQAAKAAPGMDQAVFSDEALSFAKALAEARQTESAAPSSDAARAAKVADIKARVENGTYNVSAEDVADRMIEDILARYQG